MSRHWRGESISSPSLRPTPDVDLARRVIPALPPGEDGAHSPCQLTRDMWLLRCSRGMAWRGVLWSSCWSTWTLLCKSTWNKLSRGCWQARDQQLGYSPGTAPGVSAPPSREGAGRMQRWQSRSWCKNRRGGGRSNINYTIREYIRTKYATSPPKNAPSRRPTHASQIYTPARRLA